MVARALYDCQRLCLLSGLALCLSSPVGDPTAFVGDHIALVCNYQLEKGVATGLGVFLESLLPLHVCRSSTRGNSRLRVCYNALVRVFCADVYR